MPTLFDGLRSAAQALRTTGDALAVTQLNMTNANAPGYARREFRQVSDGFDPTRSSAGGVLGSSASARSQYAEQAVWSQTSEKDFFESFTQAAYGVDSFLGLTDVSGQTGIQATLSALFRSLANLQQGSTDPVNLEDVIQRARGFALTLSQTAEYFAQSAATAQTRIENAVDQVNSLAKNVQQWNIQLNAGAKPDPAAESQIYSSLETLSSLVPITFQQEPNGGLTILLNGQIPLLQSSQLYPLSVSFAPPNPTDPFPNASAELRILSGVGEDITSKIGSGELGGLLDYTNRFIPTFLGDADQQGDLNRMAQSVADSVNNALGGTTPLFQYDSGNPANSARSLQVTATFTSSDLSAALLANPTSLGVLAGIAGGTQASDQINGQPYSEFLTSVASRAASDLNAANTGVTLQTSLLNQAQAFRERIQGASVEQSAVELLQYQLAYQAAAKVIGIIDDLTQTAIGMVR